MTLMAADHTFTRLTSWAQLPVGAHQPRIHDLRHAAAVHTLTDWYRSGEDAETIAARLPLLSTYLGHVSPASIYWYVTAVRELMHLAARRLAAGQAMEAGS